MRLYCIINATVLKLVVTVCVCACVIETLSNVFYE